MARLDRVKRFVLWLYLSFEIWDVTEFRKEPINNNNNNNMFSQTGFRIYPGNLAAERRATGAIQIFDVIRFVGFISREHRRIPIVPNRTRTCPTCLYIYIFPRGHGVSRKSGIISYPFDKNRYLIKKPEARNFERINQSSENVLFGFILL